MGDPAGIGGEIILKSLPDLCRKSIPVIIGDLAVLAAYSSRMDSPAPFRKFGRGRPGEAEFIDMGLVSGVDFGVVDGRYGEAAYRYITEALKYIYVGDVAALVTCPINKLSVHKAGIPFTGHTELLAHYGGVADYIMMMANRDMRVSLVTIHIPLRDVPDSVSCEKVLKTIVITHRSLKDLFAIKDPRIKISGLNPHAGEGGIMGNEERLIEEAITVARSLGINAEGPFPADTLFHRRDCDGFIAMYHDQGLIPIKTVDFGRTVNITLGLPFIRTSPGHGTGFDIAGKGVADPTGLIEAYRVAEEMASRLE